MKITNVKQLINGAPDEFNLRVSINNELFDIDYEKSFSEKTINVRLNKVNTAKSEINNTNSKNITDKVCNVLFACVLDVGRLSKKEGEVVSSFSLKPNEYGEFTIITESPHWGLQTYQYKPLEIVEMGYEISSNLNYYAWLDYGKRMGRILQAIAELEGALDNK